MTCSVEDCERDAACRGLCWAHYKRQARGRPVTGPLQQRDPRATLRAAVQAVADVDTSEDADAEFERAQDRLRKAAVRYAESLRR